MPNRRVSAKTRAKIIHRLQTKRERIWFRELRSFYSKAVLSSATAYASGGMVSVEETQTRFSTKLGITLVRLYSGSAAVMRDRLYHDVRGIMKKDAIDVYEETAQAWIREQSALKVVTLTASYFTDIREAVDAALVDGLGNEATASLIRSKVGKDYQQYKAARIARTESHTASEMGTRAAAKSLGIETVKEWVSAEDNRTRPDHAQANGQIREMDESFEIGGWSLMYPGDPNGPADQIINCRCVTLYHPRVAGEILR